MTLDELKEYHKGEFQNIDKIMNELFSVYKPEKSGYSLAEQAAIAAFVINIYSGIESILKQMLIFDRLDIDDSPGWHEKVLRKAGEIGILPPELFQLLSRYLSFRNYFIYSYIFNIKWEDMKSLVEALKDVVAQIRSEVDEYLLTI
ncbi:MAG TPA: hypothetical protein ENG83_09670 [Nitrospirae bacterium]|nr:hypothetical protein BMS3Abin06_02303 [bacterium BMS3Abin06]HDH12442.1 hypothetical protein [Nitrospirota bacterium]HDZ02421.1 hypothetical protein [Nitrospirota bacterium]